jgi:hypothetical protein
LYEYFTDRNLGRFDFPEYLRLNGFSVHVHADYFADAAPDEEWIPDVAARGWIILAADRDILHVPIELAAVMGSSARFLNLIGGHIRAVDLARNVVNTRARIEAFVAAHAPPFIAKVYRPNPVSGVLAGKPGSVELKMDYDGWLRSPKSAGFPGREGR